VLDVAIADANDEHELDFYVHAADKNGLVYAVVEKAGAPLKFYTLERPAPKTRTIMTEEESSDRFVTRPASTPSISETREQEYQRLLGDQRPPVLSD
ncbi:MAG: hypothetical protein AAF517_17220, partial [Planctomycetota bacterium]